MKMIRWWKNEFPFPLLLSACIAIVATAAALIVVVIVVRFNRRQPGILPLLVVMSQLYKPAILWFVEEMEKTLLSELVGSL